MWHRLLILTGATILIFGLTARAQDVGSTHAAALDHVTSAGPACPPYPCADVSPQEQARYLLGHWPRDFKIAVVHATDSPKCKHVGDRNQCTLRVKLDNLILGTQEPDDGMPGTRVGWYDSFDIHYSMYEPAAGTRSASFEVKPGDRLVAMLTPAIHPNDQPVSYVCTRVDHASDTLIESVGTTVADMLMAAAHADAKP